MINQVKEYKHVLVYLLRFVLFYLIAIKVYHYYLNLFNTKIDPFTRLTALWVQKIYTVFHIPSEVIPTENEGIKLMVENTYVARIVEGCNAISIMILFVVFILSFWKFNKRVYRFLLAGMLSILLFNVLRIALLGYILYAFPTYKDFWHRVVFPGLIYSWVILLWITFINKIVVKNE